MCGINGIYNFSGQHLNDVSSLIQAMNDCLTHRGPDDEGSWHDEKQKIFFGHRRLSIIDLSAAGHQPMVDNEKNAIVFNGEIYNYKELKPQFSNLKTESDTEVLMRLCKKEGHDALKQLNGMFAFAFWNEQKQELLLARDRLGKKTIVLLYQQRCIQFFF